MNLLEGKSYKIRSAHSNGITKTHIDSVIPNPTCTECEDARLVTFRIWSKRKRFWRWYVEPYFVLAIFNDWPYNV